jgi:hypothetical protein
VTLGPSHKLDGEEEISWGSPKLLIHYGKFTSSLFHCTSQEQKDGNESGIETSSFFFPQE